MKPHLDTRGFLWAGANKHEGKDTDGLLAMSAGQGPLFFYCLSGCRLTALFTAAAAANLHPAVDDVLQGKDVLMCP